MQLPNEPQGASPRFMPKPDAGAFRLMIIRVIDTRRLGTPARPHHPYQPQYAIGQEQKPDPSAFRLIKAGFYNI